MKWKAPPGRIRHAASYALFEDANAVFDIALDYIKIPDNEAQYNHHVKIDGSPSIGIGKDDTGTPYVYYTKNGVNRYKSHISLSTIKNPVLKEALTEALSAVPHLITENKTELIGDVMYFNNQTLLSTVKPNVLEYTVDPNKQRRFGIIFHTYINQHGFKYPIDESYTSTLNDAGMIHYGSTQLDNVVSPLSVQLYCKKIEDAVEDSRKAYSSLTENAFNIIKNHEHQLAIALHTGIKTVQEYAWKRRLYVYKNEMPEIQEAINVYNIMNEISTHTTQLINNLHLPTLNGFTPTILGHEGTISNTNDVSIKFVPPFISNLLKTNPKY